MLLLKPIFSFLENLNWFLISLRIDLQSYWFTLSDICSSESRCIRMIYTKLKVLNIILVWLSGHVSPKPRDGWRVYFAIYHSITKCVWLFVFAQEKFHRPLWIIVLKWYLITTAGLCADMKNWYLFIFSLSNACDRCKTLTCKILTFKNNRTTEI